MNLSSIALIGSVGIPNRYGGFESFAEHCSAQWVHMGYQVTVTCDANIYPDRETLFNGVNRKFISIPANGAQSVLHDLFAFFEVFSSHRYIVMLGVSGGIWFPLFRLLCSLTRKTLLINVDGVEWRRDKFTPFKRSVLWMLDSLAQLFAHKVIYDNQGLKAFLSRAAANKSHCIAYSGDHVVRQPDKKKIPYTALTICRIEPENNLDMMIAGVLGSTTIKLYTIIGNWENSSYSRSLRKKWTANPRILMLDPEYDPKEIAKYREQTDIYLHGHSVGGTNPSLVEMIFYDSLLFCFDVEFNRYTAQDCAQYFSTPKELAILLNLAHAPEKTNSSRETLRKKYTAKHIAEAYLQVMGIS